MEYSVPNTTTKLKKPLSKSVVRHSTDMLASIAKANAEGKTNRVRHLIGRHLKSYDAKLVAAKEAFRKMGRPAPKAHIEAVAAKLLPWQGSSEPARLFMKKKGNGDLRPIMNFGFKSIPAISGQGSSLGDGRPAPPSIRQCWCACRDCPRREVDGAGLRLVR